MESSTRSQTIRFRLGPSGLPDSIDSSDASAVEDVAVDAAAGVVVGAAKEGRIEEQDGDGDDDGIDVMTGEVFSGSGLGAAATNLPYFNFAAGIGGS